MNWDCTNTEERLSDFLDGALSREEAAAFSAHRAACAKCSKLVAQVGGLVQRMQRTEQLELPDRLVSNILDATLGPRKTKRGWQSWFGWAGAIWEPRFAMGIVTVAASFAIVFHAIGVTPSTIGQADLNPANVMRSANRQAHLTYGRAVKFVDDLQLVYEIRSQLEPEAQPQAAPATQPSSQPAPETAPEQQNQPQSQNPQPRSDTNSRRDSERSRSEMRDGHLLAFGIANSWTDLSATNFGVTRFSMKEFSVKGSNQ